MGIKCFNCGNQLNIDDNFCNKCGKIPLKEFNIDTYSEAYFTITQKIKLSIHAEKYRKDNYPTEMGNAMNALMGRCFTIGYNLREAEFCFKHIFKKNLKTISHNAKTVQILNSNIPESEKIFKIAEYKEMHNDKIGLGAEIEDYSIVGLKQSKQCMDTVIRDYIKSIENKLSRLNINRSDALEIIYRNASLGYCYKLAEEIVLSN